MKIGYARVSTGEQNMAMQEDALKAAGCERVISDVISGRTKRRTGLDEAMGEMKDGDTFCVWRLDRLGRSSAHLLGLMEEFKEKGWNFVSLRDNIDTSTPSGQMFFGMLAVFAQFERDSMSQRTKAGLAAARLRGRIGGRRRVHDPAAIRAKDAEMMGDRRIVCKEMGISAGTYYAALRGAA